MSPKSTFAFIPWRASVFSAAGVPMRANALAIRSRTFCISSIGYIEVSLRSSVASISARRMVSSLTQASLLI